MNKLRAGAAIILAALIGAGASLAHAGQQAIGTLPISGAGYVGAADGEQLQLLKDILAELKGLRADLRQAGPAPDSPTGTDPADLSNAKVQKAFRDGCARCHTAGDPQGGFLMFTKEGAMREFSPADRREIAKRVKADQMPKPPARLAPADKALILAAVGK